MYQRNSAATSTRPRNWTARSITLGACLIALPAFVTGCAHAQAKAQPELPPLEMPAPPPRVVEANEPVQPPQIALPEEPRTNLRQPTTSAPQRTDAPRQPEPPKQDQPPAEPPKVAEEPARSSPPPTTLQTTPAQREGEVERRVRTLIAQAYNDLNRVNYQALNADARNQYDTAKRFASQAGDALRARNLVFASNLADKAAALAAQLPGK
jgi:outer membrane biosynthesis protein TonB